MTQLHKYTASNFICPNNEFAIAFEKKKLSKQANAYYTNLLNLHEENIKNISYEEVYLLTLKDLNDGGKVTVHLIRQHTKKSIKNTTKTFIFFNFKLDWLSFYHILPLMYNSNISRFRIHSNYTGKETFLISIVNQYTKDYDKETSFEEYLTTYKLFL
ncbi:hypothetical protein [Pseudomonas juntendi]|uniref:hypothetical protein n=1 Tax=Pseudomonas juntendi TaxID=2666183 RepID=UPI002446A769|nr:hypothetical protein [Pseudomonas juntendi]MDG9889207.1 hypothetical protein [Pseudomonas juntendi]